MPKQEPFLPITLEHDYSQLPVGFALIDDKGQIVLRHNDRAKLTEKDINTMNRAFAPTYLISKVGKDGFVQEVEIQGFALVKGGK
mgnify:FL=1